jgi:hypothetical protein
MTHQPDPDAVAAGGGSLGFCPPDPSASNPLTILVTGMTRAQTSDGAALGNQWAAQLMVDALRDAGHAVDHRPPCIDDEKLDEYHVVLVGITSLSGFPCDFKYPALDTIARVHTRRGRGRGLLFFLDDWQVSEIYNSFREVSRHGARRLLEPTRNGKRAGYEWACANADALISWVKALLEWPWPTTIIPKFSWGDGQILIDKPKAGIAKNRGMQARSFEFVDPSPYCQRHPVLIPAQRERAWVSAALTCGTDEWLAKQAFTWTVEQYGRKKRGQQQLAVDDLVGRYASTRGVVSTPYPHAGSGWWRERFVHAAQAHSVIYADPREVRGLGDAFRVPLSVIERSTDEQLAEIANEQARELEARMWPAERLRMELDRIVREAQV